MEKGNVTANIDFSKVLDILPFGISIQTKDRKVIYENEKVKELVGSYRGTFCFKRWEYISGKGDHQCDDCPATISIVDGRRHHVFRKTIDRDDKELYLEIEIIPIIEKGKFNKFIEVMRIVNESEKTKILIKEPIKQIIDNLKFALTIFGKSGGEPLLFDDLNFLNEKTDIESFLSTLAVFTFSGLSQGRFEREGMYGPLPVLDLYDYSMIAFIFKISSENVIDSRNEGIEHSIIFCFFERKYYFLFENREIIENFFFDWIKKTEKLENFDKKSFNKFTKKTKELLKANLTNNN